MDKAYPPALRFGAIHRIRKLSGIHAAAVVRDPQDHESGSAVDADLNPAQLRFVAEAVQD
ncbi:hypothetical protein ACFTAO_35450 [Paenibacillus rhizoplanae]